MKKTIITAVFAFLSPSLSFAEDSKSISLFDGKTLEGWVVLSNQWRVEDGAVTAGSPKENYKGTHFVSTEKRFANFDLKLKIRCSGDPKTGLINSGIQIRSDRRGRSIAGYQIDCGANWFGKIYDEHRRGLIYPKPLNPEAMKETIDILGWNEYRILAEGPRIRVWINDLLVTDYTETNPLIPLEGVIAPQIHGGGNVTVQFKDITIKELPATPDAPTWESLGGVEEALKKVRKPKPAKPAAKK